MMWRGKLTWLGPTVVGLIAIGLFYQPVWRVLSGSPSEIAISLGHIAQVQGNVQIARHQSPTWQKAQPKQELKQGDKILVGPRSKVMVNGPAGWAFAVEHDSQILFEHRSSNPEWVIHVIAGEIRVLQNGQKGVVGLMQDGYWLEPSAQKAAPLSLRSGNVSQDVANSDSLPTPTILNTLLTQKSQMQRCYAEWLQRHPKDPGSVTLSFVLQPSGLIEAVELLGPFTDQPFQSCLQQSLERLRFPSFSGDTIVMNIPLQFEN